MCALIVVIDAGGSIELPAMASILRYDVCARHNASANEGSSMNCDDPVVTKEVAMLNNIKDTLDVLPSLSPIVSSVSIELMTTWQPSYLPSLTASSPTASAANQSYSSPYLASFLMRPGLESCAGGGICFRRG